MARKPTRRELETSLLMWEQRALALNYFAQTLGPRYGWTFVEGPRSISAFLIHVDEDLAITQYACHDKGSEELRQLESSLYRMAESNGEHDLLSLLGALKDLAYWKGEHFPNGGKYAPDPDLKSFLVEPLPGCEKPRENTFIPSTYVRGPVST